MNHRRTAAIALLVVPALAACSSGPPTRAPARPTYDCCAESDLDRPYRPGQTMTLHWQVIPAKPRPAEIQSDTVQPDDVRLRASLIGPFETETAVTSAIHENRTGDVAYTAVPVRPAGLVDEVPTSVIVIKPDAKPGYYHLETSASYGGSTVGGASIVQVVAKT